MAKKLQGPVLVHVVTKKGKGYKIAEENPDKYHGISSFDVETGKPINKKKDDYSKILGNKLIELAKKNEKIVAITAAMCDGTGLKEFKNQFPNRFFDVGIAEQHAIGCAAGMAKQGLIPVVPIYSSFYQRAYDQVIHDICIHGNVSFIRMIKHYFHLFIKISHIHIYMQLIDYVLYVIKKWKQF